MTLEQDLTRIQQQLRLLREQIGESDASDGKSLWVTYHEADLSAKPVNPIGNGETGGWSTTATANSKWMSVKLAAAIDDDVAWSDPIQIRGTDGEDGQPGQDGQDGKDGSDGGAWSDDIPEIAGVRFSVVSGNLRWTAGTLKFAGVTYTVNGNSAGLNNDYVYWNGTSGGGLINLVGTNDVATAINVTAGNWLLCKREGLKAIPASPFKVIMAGALLSGALSAINANLGQILAGEITLSGENGAESTSASARYQLRINAGGIQGRWRGSGKPVWSETPSGTPGTSTYNSGWRKIIDIANNEVKISFDSFNAGENIAGLDALANISENTAHGYGQLVQDGTMKQIGVFTLSSPSTLHLTMRSWHSRSSVNSNSWVRVEVRRATDNALIYTLNRSGSVGTVQTTTGQATLAANTVYTVHSGAYSQNITSEIAGYEFSSYARFNQNIKKV